MRRPNLKKTVLISGIFAGAVLAAFSFALLFPGSSGKTGLKVAAVEETSYISPIPGHWLMTASDRSYKPAALGIVKKTVYRPRPKPEMLRLDEADSALNGQLDGLNVMYIWTHGDRLKVISVTSLNKRTNQAAIVVIPLATVVDNESLVYLGQPYVTVAELYREQGRDAVKTFLEKKLDIKIKSYIQVNQAAVQELSDIIGPLEVNGDKLSMLQAFEETMAGLRTDDQDVVKAVGAQILRPRMLTEVPALIKIFAREIKTNLNLREMLDIFHLSQEMNMAEMRKTALPGLEWQGGGTKQVFVSEQTWKNIIWDITQ